MEIYQKPFDEWHPVKKEVHKRSVTIIFEERQVWWCHFGVNIGSEIDGKNSVFTRPVLILRKFSRTMFFGVPLTGQEKTGSWYAPVKVKERTSWIALSQARSFDSKRLRSYIVQISEEEFTAIKRQFGELMGI